MGFEPEVKGAFDELAQRHPSSFGKNAQFDVPRPGIEPGLEVPETSVMSFSLPGRLLLRQTQKVSQPRHPHKRLVPTPRGRGACGKP
jgi:hypothetical protein